MPGAGRNLLGERTQERLDALPFDEWPKLAQLTEAIGGRIQERPFCEKCIEEMKQREVERAEV